MGRWGRSTTGRQVCGARYSSCRQSRALPGECPRARALATHFASRSEQKTFAPSPPQWAQQAATRTQQRARRGQADASAPAAASESWRWPRPRKAFWHRRSAWSSQGAPVGSALQRGTQFARRYPNRCSCRPKGKTLRRVEKTFRTLIPRHPATFGCVASQWGVFIRGDHQNCSCHGAGRPPVFVRFHPPPR